MKTFKSTEELIEYYMPNYWKEMQDKECGDDPIAAGTLSAKRIINNIKKDIGQLFDQQGINVML